MATLSSAPASDLPAGPDGGLAASAAHQAGEETGRRTAERWLARLLVIGGALLAAWTGYLAVSLPARSVSWHYNLAWVGFDVLILVALLATAWLSYRRSPQAGATAGATAALLVADAWVDITTSAPGRPLTIAIVLAAVVELPVAFFMIRASRHWVARRPSIQTHHARGQGEPSA